MLSFFTKYLNKQEFSALIREVKAMPKNSILIIIAPENFRDEEFFEPKAVFEKEGFSVTVASKGVNVAKGRMGGSAEIGKDISAVNVDEYGAVVFVGGAGAGVYLEDSNALSIAREAYDKGKVIAAICMAPSILANAGILEGKKATCFSSEASNLEEQGAKYTGSNVEIDGNVITADGPKSSKEFGIAVANAVKRVLQ